MPDPLDPFEPQDDSPPDPIDDEERAALLDDLADLAEFRAALEQRGFLGVVISCPDCEEDHFFGWSLLRENLEHILQHGEPRVHEPAFEPAVDHYVTWDYAKGFVDGLLEGGSELGQVGEVVEEGGALLFVDGVGGRLVVGVERVEGVGHGQPRQIRLIRLQAWYSGCRSGCP